MTRFIALSENVQSLYAVWYGGLMILALCLIIQLFLQRSIKPAVNLILLFLLEYTALQSLFLLDDYYTRGRPMDPFTSFFTGLPWIVVAGTGAALTLLQVWEMRRVFRWRRTHVTNHSVKEGLDALPMGVCRYRADGRIELKNRTMEELFRGWTGRALLNGRELEETVRSLAGITEAAQESGGILVPSEYEGRRQYWRLQMRESGREADFRELLATDVTEEYEKTRLLREKRLQVESLNERLTAYNREIVSIVSAQELLNARIRLHDNMGQLLLTSRKYLLRGADAEEKARLLAQMRISTELLLKDRTEDSRDHLDRLRDAARDMGVSLNISGELPSDENQREVILTAMHENLTNTIRHAHGDILTVRLSAEGDRFRAVFENNGLLPAGGIEERGGLKALRTLTEKCGGTMEVRTQGRFRMEICL